MLDQDREILLKHLKDSNNKEVVRDFLTSWDFFVKQYPEDFQIIVDVINDYHCKHM